MIRMILAAACAVALAGCGLTGTGAVNTAGTIAAKADNVVLTAERAFGVAEVAYTVTADGVGVLVDAGVIHGATATKFRQLNAAARDLLVRGKGTTDLAEKARIAMQLFGLRDQVEALKKEK